MRIWLLLLCAASLIVINAYILEYLLNYGYCYICELIRYCYIAMMIMAVFALVLRYKFNFLAFSINLLILFIIIGLSIYKIGAERLWFSNLCYDYNAVDSMLSFAERSYNVASCSVVHKLFGIPISQVSLIIGLLLIICLVKIMLLNRKINKLK